MHTQGRESLHLLLHQWHLCNYRRGKQTFRGHQITLLLQVTKYFSNMGGQKANQSRVGMIPFTEQTSLWLGAQ